MPDIDGTSVIEFFRFGYYIGGMARLLLALAALLIAAPAFAGKDDAAWNPPARFDRPYDGKMTVRYIPQKQVIAACNRLFARHKMSARATLKQRGCAVTPNDKTCIVIIMDAPNFGTTPKAVLRHETGHCNGWSGDHPS